MERTKINTNRTVPFVKRAIQLLCFLLLPGLFTQIFYSIKSVLLLVLHQQGTLQSVAPDILLLVIATAVTAVAGRFFCGWMCAFGSMSDFLYRLPRLRKKNPRRYLADADPFLKVLKYIILGFIVIFIWGFQLITIPSGTNPWELFGMLVSFGNWPTFNELVQSWIPASVLLLLIMAASVLVERFFCRYLCPLGAYFNIISRLRLLTVSKKTENCGGCTLCTKKCSMGINLRHIDHVKNGECIDCMECTRACPTANAHLEMSDKSKNVLVAGAVSCALISGGYYLGDFSSDYLTENAYAATEVTANGVAANLADGTYTGSGTGYHGQTTVDVTVANGAITNIDITSTNDDSEYINKASSAIISEILNSQSTDVDTVSGATYSSNGIIEAVKNALGTESSTDTASTETAATATQNSASTNSGSNQSSTATTADSTLNLTDGTYTGTGTGYRGDTSVTVTVSGGKITDITVDSYQDDQEYFSRAASTVISEMISEQSVNVDAVSGATYSSNGLKEAVADALSVDYTPSEIQNEGHGPGGEGGGPHGNF